MGLDPRTFSAGSPVNRSPPLIPQAFHRRLGGQKPAQRADSKAGVRVVCLARLIAQPRARLAPVLAAWQLPGTVVFAIHADDRPVLARFTVRPVGAEGGGHPGRSFLDREAFGPQPRHIPFCGAVFTPGGLAEIEDRRAPIRQIGRARIDCGKRVGLGCGFPVRTSRVSGLFGGACRRAIRFADRRPTPRLHRYTACRPPR